MLVRITCINYIYFHGMALSLHIAIIKLPNNGIVSSKGYTIDGQKYNKDKQIYCDIL